MGAAESFRSYRQRRLTACTSASNVGSMNVAPNAQCKCSIKDSIRDIQFDLFAGLRREPFRPLSVCDEAAKSVSIEGSGNIDIGFRAGTGVSVLERWQERPGKVSWRRLHQPYPRTLKPDRCGWWTVEDVRKF